MYFFFFLKHAVSVENIYMLAQRFDYKIDEWLAKDPKYRSYTQEWNRMHAYFMCTVHTSTCFLFFLSSLLWLGIIVVDVVVVSALVAQSQ